MKRLVLILLLSIPGFLFAQERFVVDSLTIQLETVSQDSSKIKILWKLSSLFQNSNLKKSVEYLDAALKIAGRNNLPDLQGSSYQKMGDVLLLKGLYDLSLDNYLKGKRIFEESRNNRALVGLENNIGSIYYRLNQKEKALECYKGALAECNKTFVQGDSFYHSQIHIFYNSVGIGYEATGDYEVAKSYFLKALQGAKKFDDVLNLGVIYNNLGKLSLERGQKVEALQFIKLALSHRTRINDKNGMARSYLFLAEYYSQIRDYSQAMATIKKALELAAEVGAMSTSKESYNLLYKFYQKLGKPDEALDAYIKFHQYSDSLVNEASVKDITSLQMRYDFDKLEKVRKVKQQRKEMIFIFLIAILGLGMIIMGLLYGFIKNRAHRIILEKENLEKDLEVKNKELTTNVMYLLKKNELIINISKRLLQLKTCLRKENMGLLQKIIFDLEAGANQDVWEEFEYRFQQVHTEFYQKLKEKFPYLTPGEIRLCAFLRLNMTSKQISSITHQNPKSVEVARGRLRKKFCLTNTEVHLYSFLEGL